MDTIRHIGKTVVALRNAFHITQDTLAINAAIDRRYLSDIENGKRNISIGMVEKLAVCFDITLQQLLSFGRYSDLEAFKSELSLNGFEETVLFENPDFRHAIIGVSADGRVIYDYKLMVISMMLMDSLTHEDAIEFIEYNTLRAIPYMGDNAPIIID